MVKYHILSVKSSLTYVIAAETLPGVRASKLQKRLKNGERSSISEDAYKFSEDFKRHSANLSIIAMRCFKWDLKCPKMLWYNNLSSLRVKPCVRRRCRKIIGIFCVFVGAHIPMHGSAAKMSYHLRKISILCAWKTLRKICKCVIPRLGHEYVQRSYRKWPSHSNAIQCCTKVSRTCWKSSFLAP